MFTERKPSARYQELLKQYQDFHTDSGETFLGIEAEDTYPGVSLIPHIHTVKALIEKTHSKTMLDYGAGKGRQYKSKIRVGGQPFKNVPAFWGIGSVHCHDPAYPPFMELPKQKFHGVVCTDVLEH